MLRIDRLATSPWSTSRSLLAMTAAVLRSARRADVVTAHHMLSTAYLVGIAGSVTGTPAVIVPAATATRADSDLGSMVGGSISARIRRICSIPIRRRGIAVAISNDIGADLLRLGFRRVVHIPNGVVDPGRVDRARLRAQLYEPLHIPFAAKVVAAAGRLEKVKGFDVLLDAWAHSREAADECVLIIVGSGSESTALQNQSLDLGIATSVRFLPASRHAADFLAAADLVAVASRSEGLSNVLLESMAAGVPVVATRVSGNVDLIRDGDNGRLVPPEDPEALAAAICELLDDPGDIGKRGRESVLSGCELGRVVDLYERLFARARDIPEGLTTEEQLAQCFSEA